ncbi:unnamed protein product [Caenorhabditis brenneri]
MVRFDVRCRPSMFHRSTNKKNRHEPSLEFISNMECALDEWICSNSTINMESFQDPIPNQVMTLYIMTPSFMPAPLVHDFTYPFWNPYGTWNIHRMGGGLKLKWHQHNSGV